MSRSVQEKNAGGNVTDENTTKKQWEDIDNHMRQMNVWTDESYSPLSTSPCRGASVNAPVVSRAQRPHHNQHYRRSEGDIQGRTLDQSVMANPPQSAPVLPKGFELKWGNAPMHARNLSNDTILESRVYFPNSPKDPGTPAADNCANPSGENISNHNSDNMKNFPHMESGRSTIHSNFASDGDNQQKADVGNRSYATSYHRLGAFEQSHIMATGHSSGNNSPQLHSSTSSPSLMGNAKNYKILVPSSNVSNDNPSIHMPLYPQNPTMFNQPGISKIVTSPTERRKSAPVAMSEALFNRNRNAMFGRAITQPQLLASSGMPSFPMSGFAENPEIPDVAEEEIVTTAIHYDGKYDDKEYTIALLQHQSDRMHRLKTEYEAKQKELASLVKQVEMMEAKLIQRNTNVRSPSPSTSLQADVGRLREVNRKLEIDCNCMYKEVDLFAREGDSTREDFYSRYNRPSMKLKPKKEVSGNLKSTSVRPDLPPPPVPPPSEVEDEPKWRCSHCTFDNHAALNKCEMCEFSRGVQPGRPAHP